MTGDVVDLASRRADATFQTCRCGSVWWEAAVVIEDGSVTGYSDVRCRDCGAIA